MLDKRYDHRAVESGKYEKWKEKGYFKADNQSNKPPFCIVIPPPNVTGKLHIGHAWDNTIQDIAIRYRKLKGDDTLYLPGMDHAGIATEAKVMEKLRHQGVDTTKLTREEFLKWAWSWKDEYADSIHKQWAKMGLALDYLRERFTLDEGCNYAVRKVFVDLYNQGLIYQGYKIINWDPVQKTALSNIEVIHQDDQGYMYYFKYPIIFEHGSPVIDSDIKANSVLHAHTHIVNYNFINEIDIINQLNFKEINNLSYLTKDKNYIMYINHNNTYYLTNNFEPISQIMRILIAKELGYEDKFDWKKDMFIDNIIATIKKFKKVNNIDK